MTRGSFFKKALLGLGLCAGLTAISSIARADYVCQLSPSFAAGGGGTDGFIFFTVYTGANCGGSFVKSTYLCSTGATGTFCPSSGLHSKDSLYANFAALQRSAVADQRISLVSATCNGGAAGCTALVNYFGQ